MGLFDALKSELTAKAMEVVSRENPQLGTAIAALTNPANGGIGGLVKAFEEKGLGNIAASWVGTGQNLPVTPEQIQAVLGSDKIRALASSMGVDPEQAKALLTQHLPGLVDKMTPDGRIPQ